MAVREAGVDLEDSRSRSREGEVSNFLAIS